MTQANVSADLYALLIGVNCYLPNRLSDGSVYGNLEGAVRDIEDVEKFLDRQPQKPKQIFKLTATSSETSSFIDPPKPLEPAEKLPTYGNIIRHFDEVTKIGKPGDLVYIHYSGHGGRAKTTKPEIKTNGIDEAIVPTDIGTGEGQYVRDWELAILLKRMVDKGLVVTVILDSCHSGGSTRGKDAKVRGLLKEAIDTTPRLTESLVQPSREELAIVAPGWQNLKYTTRGGTPVASMLPEAEGYVLLAACRPSELAYEYAFDGQESNGALTYWLLDTLAQPNPGITYRMIHDRLKGKINTQFSTQNPMLLGEGDRYRLAVGEVIYEICDRTGEPVILRPAIKVTDTDAAAKIVKRLVHLAKYQATQELDNYDLNSELKGKIAIKILGKQADYEPGDPPEPEPFVDSDNFTLKVGEYLFIEIHNNSAEVLNFTVLDLESNWAISQIEPFKATSQFTPLDPGESKLITLSMSLPEGDQAGADIFKVFATKDAANFRWLTLPALDKPFLTKAERGITRSALNPLEELLSSFAAEHPTRTGNPVAFASNDWTTVQVTINLTTGK
jgi:hypothetical protein